MLLGLSLYDERVSISATASEVNEVTIKVKSSSVLLMKLKGTVLMDTLLGTVVTVLVAWTEFRYKIGSPSFGTKLVGTIDKPFWEGFLSESGRFVGRKGFVGKLSYCMVSYDMVLYDMCLWCRERGARKRLP